MRKFLAAFLFIQFCFADVYGQLQASRNFRTITSEINNYYNQVGKNKPGYKQFKRWEWYYSTRLGPNGMMVNNDSLNREALRTSSVNRVNMNQRTTANTGAWSAIGPASVSSSDRGIGRTNRIAFHPTNVNTLYVAGATGGLWITTDGGSNWYSYSEGIPNMSLSGVAVDHSNPSIIYILTGDADAKAGSSWNGYGLTKTSIGVLKSYDGGFTWHRTGLRWNETDNVNAYKLIMHPTNPSILFVATNEGIFRTTNGGTTWTSSNTNSRLYDMEFHPTNPAIVYASGITADSIIVLKSTNTGVSFTQTHGIRRSNNAAGRGASNRSALGVTPANPSMVYLFTGPCTAAGQFQGLYRSSDVGETFTTRATTPNILGRSSFGTDDDDQEHYDMAIAVSPTNSNQLALGAIYLWTSTNGGTGFSFQNEDNSNFDYYHVDIHDLAYHPLDNSRLYMCGDGGVYISLNNGNTWSAVHGNLQLTQYYKIAANPNAAFDSDNIIIGGTQDNGTNKRGSSGGPSFTQILGADGMDCIIDPDGAATYIASIQQGVFYHSTNSGSTLTKFADSGIVAGAINNRITDRWVTPVAEITGNTNQFVLGYSPSVLATNIGPGWVFTQLGWSGLTFVKTARGNANRIWVGDNDFLSQNIIKTTTNLGSTWTTVLDEPNTTPMTDMAFDPTNGSRVWVTYGGYNSFRKVRFFNGTQWTDVNGSLPNVPVNCILYDGSAGAAPDALYIGTDIGVFYRDANLGDWIPFSNELPVVEITDLEMHPVTGMLRAGTYGRGIWETSRYSGCPSTITLNTSNTAIFKPYYFQASSSVNSTAQHHGAGANVFYKAGGSVVLTPGFTASSFGENVFEAALGPCGGGVPAKVQGVASTRIRGVLVH